MRTIMAAALAATAAGTVCADIITQWDFNGDRAGKSLTSPAASIGLGTAGLLAGNTAVWAAGSPSDPAPSLDDRWNTTTYAGQGEGSGTRGVEYAVSTVGYSDVWFSSEVRNSNTSSAFIEIMAAYDGVNFTASLGVFSATAGDQWNSRSVPLGAAGADNANLRVRVVAVFAPGTGAYQAANPSGSYATTGTIGHDLVTFNGTRVPTPGTLVLAGMGAWAVVRRRR